MDHFGRQSRPQDTGCMRIPASQNTFVGSTYQQQRRFFLDNRVNREPRLALFEDLDKSMQVWMEAKENIVLAGDFNCDVRLEEIQSWIRKWNLRDSVLSIHGSNAPPTYNNGSCPIDAIFVSANIAVSRSGYLGFGDGDVGDHRCLWVDITNRSLLGFSPAKLTKASERRVTTKHPWVVRRYNAIYETRHDQR